MLVEGCHVEGAPKVLFPFAALSIFGNGRIDCRVVISVKNGLKLRRNLGEFWVIFAGEDGMAWHFCSDTVAGCIG